MKRTLFSIAQATLPQPPAKEQMPPEMPQPNGQEPMIDPDQQMEQQLEEMEAAVFGSPKTNLPKGLDFNANPMNSVYQLGSPVS